MTVRNNLRVPIINLNGTSVDVLIEEAKEARQKVREALEAVSKMTVHGRDYQTSSNPNDFREAQEQYHQRVSKLHDLDEELLHYYLKLLDQKRK